MNIPKHPEASVEEHLKLFFDYRICRDTFCRALFSDSMRYRVNVDAMARVDNRHVDFDKVDWRGFELTKPDGDFGQRLGSLCDFLARQNPQTYRSLLVLTFDHKKFTMIFCGKFVVADPDWCIRLTQKLNIPDSFPEPPLFEAGCPL